jgi:hypothetical protein
MASFIQFSEYRDREPNLKRGRRLITIEPGITSELGGLEPRPNTAAYFASTPKRGGVRIFDGQGQGRETQPFIKVTGCKRSEQKSFDETDPTRSDRGDFVVTPGERNGRKHMEPVSREAKPVGIKLCPRDIEVAPFATSSDANPIPFHRQRKFVEVPGQTNNDPDQPPPQYVPKRSRTPPASVKEHCEAEGFTVIYSTNSTDKARQVAGGMRMIPFSHHGKGTHNSDFAIAQRREEAEAKREAAYLAHRQYLRQVAQRIVDGRVEVQHGKKIGVFHPPEREGGPNAMDLPTPRNYVVGKSMSRARSAWRS